MLTVIFVSFLFFFFAFILLAILKRPIYRLTADNIVQLFDLVLSGEATEDDWDVFIEMPIRYNDDLEHIRLASIHIYEESIDGRSTGFLMTKDGLAAIAELREQLISLNDR